jgi:hypothetical protein
VAPGIIEFRLRRRAGDFRVFISVLALAGSQKLSGWNCAITFTGVDDMRSAIHSLDKRLASDLIEAARFCS